MHPKHCITEARRKVEETPLTQLLISGECSKFEWATFLANQRICHIAIESRKIITLHELMRTARLSQDLSSMGFNCKTPELAMSQTSFDYASYIKDLEVPKLWAHIYVRYLIDMGTSSAIKVAIDFPSTNLDFDHTDECFKYIRSHMIDVDDKEIDSALNWILDEYKQIFNAIQKSDQEYLTFAI